MERWTKWESGCGGGAVGSMEAEGGWRRSGRAGSPRTQWHGGRGERGGGGHAVSSSEAKGHWPNNKTFTRESNFNNWVDAASKNSSSNNNVHDTIVASEYISPFDMIDRLVG